jgi:small subunit ribosomal protein S1
MITTMNQQMTTQEFLEAIDASMKHYTKGQLVSGTIVQISTDGALVDIGHKTEGFIPKSELIAQKGATVYDIVSIGEVVEAQVIGRNTEEDQYILSLKEGQMQAYWNDLQNYFEISQPIIGKVSKAIKGGLIVDIGTRAFLPGSQIELNRVDDMSGYIGQELEFLIIQFDREKKNVVLSRRALLEQAIKEDKNIEFAKLAIGQIHNGIISGVADYGAFVNIGLLSGLIHKSKVENFTPEMFTVGQEVQVEIVDIDFEKSRLSLAVNWA